MNWRRKRRQRILLVHWYSTLETKKGKGRLALAPSRLTCYANADGLLLRPRLAKGMEMTTVRLLANCLWRSTASGLFIGALVGGVYGVVTGLLVGFILGFSFGAAVGMLIGALNGVILAALIRLCFFSTFKVRTHARIIASLGLVLGIAGTTAFVTFLLTPPDQALSWPRNIERWEVIYAVVPALAAGWVGWKVNRSIIEWFLFEVG